MKMKKEELEELFGIKGDNKKDIKIKIIERSEEDLKKLVVDYLKKEVKGEFQLEPKKAFEYGRKVRNEYSLTLREVEKLVNFSVYPAYEEMIGEIKTILCHQFYENYLGYFISGLYHDVIGKRKLNIEIRLPKLIARSRVGFRWGFGYRHSEGEIIIKGYAGGYVGEGMRGGKIVVVGYTGDCIGKDMKGGEIIIKGDVGWRVGESMRGGKIVVFGDAGEYVGINMKAGTIKIKGNVLSFGRREGGKIEIWKNGGWVAVN